MRMSKISKKALEEAYAEARDKLEKKRDELWRAFIRAEAAEPHLVNMHHKTFQLAWVRADQAYIDECDRIARMAAPGPLTMAEAGRKPKEDNMDIAITGNTYPVRDQLRQLGGRWDPDQKAWMVPADRAEEARAIVAGAAGAGAPTPRPNRPARRPARRPSPPQPKEGEEYVYRPSRGPDDPGYQVGAVYHFRRIGGGGGPDGHYWVVVHSGRRRYTQYDDDTREGEWYQWAIVRPATPEEAAPAAAEREECERRRARRCEIAAALREAIARGEPHDNSLPPGTREIWGVHVLGGSAAWYIGPDGSLYYWGGRRGAPHHRYHYHA